MADEAQPTLALETSPAATSAPVASAPAPAAVDVVAAPAAEAPVTIAPAPIIEDAPALDKPDAQSLLSAEPEVEKPVDAPVEKPVDAPVEDKPSDAVTETPTEAAVLPTYEPFTLPEGFTANEAVNNFTKELAEFEASKPDHTKFQEFGQKLMDSHIEALDKALKDQTNYFIQLNDRQKASDLESLRNDPVIGKGGDAEAFQAFGKDFVNFIARNGGTKEEVTAFREFTKERGVDNALPIIRVINNLKNKIERYEKEASSILPGTKPAVAAPQHPGKGMTGRLYGGGK